MSGKISMERPEGSYLWDVFISCRKGRGLEYEFCLAVYLALTDKSMRVFWEPLCIPKNLNLGQRDRELKYIQAAANSVMAVVIVSKTTFFTRDIDVSKYVWSSTPDELLLEWDLLLELYEAERLQRIVPALMGDLMNSNFVKMQERVMGRLGLTSLDEKSIVARVREIFKLADADRSGSIEKGELRTTFKKFGLIVTEPELDAMMTKFDYDGNDGIDVFEFEDLIVELLEEKCGVTIAREGVVKPRGDDDDQVEEEKDMIEEAVEDDDDERSIRSEGSRYASKAGSRRSSVIRRLSETGQFGDLNDMKLLMPPPSPGGSDSSRRSSLLSDDDSDTEKPRGKKHSKKDESEAREFFANFWECDFVPRLPPVVCVAAMRKVTLWLVHDLKFLAQPVMWREKHFRPIPGLESEGRTIEQTINMILKFPNAHVIEGMKRRTIDPLVNRIVSDWTECVRLQKVTRIKGGKKVTTLCRNTGRPAKFLDPITSVPFASTLAFNRMRSTYYFDPSRCHESVLLEDFSTRATYASTGGNGVLLTPPASATGVSYVEFVLEVTGTHSHMHIGVCDGTFDVVGGWTALSDPDTWLYSVYNMKKVHQGAIEDFGTVSPKKGDRLGLLVDMDNRRMDLFINDVLQGTLAENLTQPLYFCIDFGWPGQVVSISQRDHWQSLSQCVNRFFAGLDANWREAKMKALFHEFDVDGSMTISQEELDQAFKKMHVYLADTELEWLMRFVDEDESGEIEFEEFQHMVKQIIEMGGDKSRMKRMDKIRSYAGSQVSGSRVAGSRVPRASKPGAENSQMLSKDIEKNDFLALDKQAVDREKAEDKVRAQNMNALARLKSAAGAVQVANLMAKGVKKSTSEPGFPLQGDKLKRSGSFGSGGGSMRGPQGGSLSGRVLHDEFKITRIASVASQEQESRPNTSEHASRPTTAKSRQRSADKAGGGEGWGQGEWGRVVDRGGPVDRSVDRGGPVDRSVDRGGPVDRSVDRGGPVDRSVDRGGPVADGGDVRASSSRGSGGGGTGGFRRLGTEAGSDAASQRSYKSQDSAKSGVMMMEGDESGMRPITRGSNGSKRTDSRGARDAVDGAVILPPIHSPHHR